MENLQKIYEDAYKKEWERRKGTSPIRVVDNSTGQVYENEGNFFLCGFTSLRFWCKGKNRELKRVLAMQGLKTKPAYGGGLRLYMNEIGHKGNGDFEIQKHAYSQVSNYLNGLGYMVYIDSMLD